MLMRTSVTTIRIPAQAAIRILRRIGIGIGN